MLAWELIGAAVGAGLASGREIATFFSQYGGWSYTGIMLSVLVTAVLADTRLPASWASNWRGTCWSMLLSLLLIATGGAMLSGAGETAALMLPVRGAYWLGMAGTLMLAWCLARRTVRGLAVVSRGLTAVLIVMISLGLFQEKMSAVPVQGGHSACGLLRGVAYGGFNAALQVPIMASAKQAHKGRSAWAASVLIAAVLMLGNAVLLRHPALIGEPLPFVRMMAAWGKPGFWLSAVCIYLAVLSTLTACIRGLSGSVLTFVGIMGIALCGFSSVVSIAYPLLGGACFGMLLLAKFSDSHINPFHSRQNMI